MTVTYMVLGESLDHKGSSVCRRHEEGFLEEVMGATEIRPFFQAASIQVSQLPDHRPGG